MHIASSLTLVSFTYALLFYFLASRWCKSNEPQRQAHCIDDGNRPRGYRDQPGAIIGEAFERRMMTTARDRNEVKLSLCAYLCNIKATHISFFKQFCHGQSFTEWSFLPHAGIVHVVLGDCQPHHALHIVCHRRWFYGLRCHWICSQRLAQRSRSPRVRLWAYGPRCYGNHWPSFRTSFQGLLAQAADVSIHTYVTYIHTYICVCVCVWGFLQLPSHMGTHTVAR